ncbi:Trm112 family protein [Candidatus Blochmannia ocreatus (nom. nud.)]|uniref:Uncharacterized protein n=1 Tax=Candidatus Blochmannia ocreatus (nom. nud.) TaxID=251538 RepID=A0ABY4SU66_9ENTR|nr:Trm112 family protein [Candidatus Blochmannia ocreatus]URJ25421.1 hypothetical protein M9405_01810 [Candidatus Blochmannia ocreatus]
MRKELLFQIIVCPICYRKLSFNSKREELVCNIDNVIFPIRYGIPVLLKNKI